ncbi:MAG: glycosyltransferase family 2 protein, partial [Gaiellales bacterium]
MLLSGPRVREQLAALADAASNLELLVATDGVGRRECWQRAAEGARGDVLVAFDAVAEPTVEAVERLAADVRAGAALAFPTITSANREVHGYRATPDGALWPIVEAGSEPDAVALDCLAARPATFRSLPAWDVVAGPYERQVVDAARAIGPVVRSSCKVARRSCGPSLSIVVCTRDRADEVAECVDACVELDLAGNDAELIVVDNGSSDGTAVLLVERAARYGDRVRVVREPLAGLSLARNAGAAVATGELLTFLDDDARPGPGWLEHLRLSFLDPGVAIAGGPIYGLWPDGRPAGFPPATAAPYLGILDRGDAPHDSARPEDGPWGGNWTGRRSLIDALGGFDARFGAGELGNLGGEEVHLGWRLLERGLGRLRFVPGAAVGHRAPKARVLERYVLLRAYRCGIEDIRLREALGRDDGPAIDASAGNAA